jgi:hypothetical protein
MFKVLRKPHAYEPQIHMSLIGRLLSHVTYCQFTVEQTDIT